MAKDEDDAFGSFRGDPLGTVGIVRNLLQYLGPVFRLLLVKEQLQKPVEPITDPRSVRAVNAAGEPDMRKVVLGHAVALPFHICDRLLGGTYRFCRQIHNSRSRGKLGHPEAKYA